MVPAKMPKRTIRDNMNGKEIASRRRNEAGSFRLRSNALFVKSKPELNMVSQAAPIFSW